MTAASHDWAWIERSGGIRSIPNVRARRSIFPDFRKLPRQSSRNPLINLASDLQKANRLLPSVESGRVYIKEIDRRQIALVNIAWPSSLRRESIATENCDTVDEPNSKIL
jgi:hypothetical protein